ncbi:sulfurtransferase [uncultured Paracoccus sp.]|uniref:sulfurtransferase n=1 Tax=uncultured Paracoccus sp. TaxID=189685 RepID=UPI0026128359|nr:rhodanese-like domain-containing protein [uncultured Paracoccus sp.]
MASTAWAVDLPGPLVSTDWLAEHQEEVLVLDVRNDDASFLESGHIIGAIPLDFRKARGSEDEGGVTLDSMNLPPEEFSALMQSVGLDQDEPVVLTHRGRGPDDVGYAAYVYWQLKYYGHDNVALLDGGTDRWIAEDREFWGEEEEPEPGDFVAAEADDAVHATTEDVKAMVDDPGQDVLDARFFSFYVGMDKRDTIPKAGHIPTAALFPFDGVFTADLTFRPTEQLDAAATAVGLAADRPVAAYCNTGHVSAISWFVLSELLGYQGASLYDGSMLAWAKHDLPTETALK